MKKSWIDRYNHKPASNTSEHRAISYSVEAGENKLQTNALRIKG